MPKKEKSVKQQVNQRLKNKKESEEIEIPIVSGILKKERTLGQKAADNLTKYAGSWIFIIGFFIFLVLWMSANIYAWINTWDPYPFILLNLVLSCLAAVQAPIILMSQNRQSEKDRQKAEYDYAINRKTQREVQELKKQLNRIEKKLK